MLKRLIFVFATLLALTILVDVNQAEAEEGHHSLGVQAGEVGLSSDVGNIYSNALGMGAFFDYAASDFLEFELSWINSHHTGTNPLNASTLNLQQNAYALALQYNIDTYDIFTPYIKGGAEFVTHTQDIVGANNQTGSYSTTGFGLDAAAGCKVNFTQNLMAGLDLTYHSIFTASVTPTGNFNAVNTIESYFTVMLRFGFTFGGEKAPSYKN
jgi:opacity protein-like surface antigen